MASTEQLNDLRAWRARELAYNREAINKDAFLTGLRTWMTDRGVHFIKAHYRQFILNYIVEKEPSLKLAFDPNDFDAACVMLIADLMYSMNLHLTLSVFAAEVAPRPDKSPRLSAMQTRLKLLIDHPQVKDLLLTFKDVVFILDKLFGVQTGSESFYRLTHDYLNNKDPLLTCLIHKLFKISDRKLKPKSRNCILCNIERHFNRVDRSCQTDSAQICHKLTQIDPSDDQLEIQTTTKRSETLDTEAQTDREFRSVGINTSRPASTQTDDHSLGVNKSSTHQSNTEFQTECKTLLASIQKESPPMTRPSKGNEASSEGVQTFSPEKIDPISRHYEEKLELLSTIDKLKVRLDEVTARNEQLQNELTLVRRRSVLLNSNGGGGEGFDRSEVSRFRRITTQSAASQTHSNGLVEGGDRLRVVSESIACLKNERKVIDAYYKK